MAYADTTACDDPTACADVTACDNAMARPLSPPRHTCAQGVPPELGPQLPQGVLASGVVAHARRPR